MVGHVAPEAACGGPIALVRDGDIVSIDVDARTLELELDAAELAARRAGWRAPRPRVSHGVLARYARNVGSASAGAVIG